MDFEPPQTPMTGMPGPDPDMPPPFEMEGTEPAWERKEEIGFFQAMLETVQQVLLNPSETFSRLFVGGGFVNPLIFATILVTGGYFISSLYQLLLGGVITAAAASFGAPAGLAEQMVGNVASLVLTVVMGPILAVVISFVGAGIYHLILMMLGGMRGDFETTFRVHTYALGSSMALYLVPGCGSTIGWIWGMVCAIIGLSRAHEIDTWKAAVAVLGPTAICCLLTLAAFGALFATGFAAGMSGATP